MAKNKPVVVTVSFTVMASSPGDAFVKATGRKVKRSEIMDVDMDLNQWTVGQLAEWATLYPAKSVMESDPQPSIFLNEEFE